MGGVSVLLTRLPRDIYYVFLNRPIIGGRGLYFAELAGVAGLRATFQPSLEAMPPLRACGRRWEFASDDLVIPGSLLVAIRSIWLIIQVRHA